MHPSIPYLGATLLGDLDRSAPYLVLVVLLLYHYQYVITRIYNPGTKVYVLLSTTITSQA